MRHTCSPATEEGIDPDACDIETALNHVGVGLFQWMALAVCGLANAADAVEILGMSLVLPAAEADPSMQLTAGGKSALSSCIFLGMLLGGILWGPMGDVLGRRRSLLVALLINAFFGLMSAGARSVGALVALRLLAGVGVGGSVPVVFSFLAELLPAHSRGRFMVGLAAHWMVGSIFSAGMGWAIIPTGPDRWRLFLAVASLPAWCAVVGTWLMPESPRYLLVQGYTEEAEQVLHKMASINGRSLHGSLKLIPHKSHHLSRPPASPFPAAATAVGPGSSTEHVEHHSSSSPLDLQMEGVPSSSTGMSQRGRGISSSTGAQAPAARTTSRPSQQQDLQQHWKQQQRGCCRSSAVAAKLLLQPPLRRRFLPLMVAWLGLCGGWYSTVLWIPEYFKARGAHAASIYAETFAVAAANLPGNIASIFMVDWLGRRLTACICLAGSCAAALLFAFAPADPLWSVVAACTFNAISVGGWNALDLLSAELFATEVRSTAMGLLGAGGRLASFATTFLAGALMQVLLWSPLLVAAALLAAGSIAILLLPEMAHKPLEDTVEDAADSEIILNIMADSTSSRRHRGGSSSGQQQWPHHASQQQQLQQDVELSPASHSYADGSAEVGGWPHRPAAGQQQDETRGPVGMPGGAQDDAASSGVDSREAEVREERVGLLRAPPPQQ